MAWIVECAEVSDETKEYGEIQWRVDDKGMVLNVRVVRKGELEQERVEPRLELFSWKKGFKWEWG